MNMADMDMGNDGAMLCSDLFFGSTSSAKSVRTENREPCTCCTSDATVYKSFLLCVIDEYP